MGTNIKLATLLEPDGSSAFRTKAGGINASTTDIGLISGAITDESILALGAPMASQLFSGTCGITFTGSYAQGTRMGWCNEVSGGDTNFENSKFRSWADNGALTYPSEVLGFWMFYNNANPVHHTYIGSMVVSSSNGTVDGSVTGYGGQVIGYNGASGFSRILTVDGEGKTFTFVPTTKGFTSADNGKLCVVECNHVSLSGKASIAGQKAVYELHYVDDNTAYFTYSVGASLLMPDGTTLIDNTNSNHYDWMNGTNSAPNYIDMLDYMETSGLELTMYKASAGQYVNTAGVDMTGLGTQTFLDTGISGIKDSSPASFDTLGEIASAMPSNADVSAYINLNTGSRLHTIVGDGTTTDFSVTHNSGNVDVFVDGVLRIPHLSDSASGATTVLSSYDYYSKAGLVSLGTGDTYTSLYSDQRLFTRPAFPDLWDWLIAQGAPIWGAPWSGTPALTFEYNGATATYTGLTWVLYDTYGGAAPWVGHMLSYQNGGLNGFLPQGGATNVTVKGEATSPSSTSGESCPKIVFQDAPMSGQTITVKTY